ncbi:MAG: hypothetical protein HC827_00075 [Cyanobacteria bacterium RM1_2_2]|nr:hypothetical protein [Cyanobacteria bacterium RM1_2_2]
MRVKWGKMAAKVTVWLAAEILFGLVGLDSLADYGEFTLNDATLSPSNSALQMVVGIIG